MPDESMQNAAREKRGDSTGPLDNTTQPDGAIVTFAYTAYWSFLASCLVFPVPSQEQVGATLTIIPALFGMLAFSIAVLVATKTGWLLGGRRARGPMLLFAAMSLPLLCAQVLAAFGVQANLLMQGIAWTAWGVGQAAIFPLIGCMQTRVDQRLGGRKGMPLLVAGSFVGVGVLCTLALFAPDPLRSFLPLAYGTCTLLAIAVSKCRGLAHDIPAREGLSDDFAPLASPKILSPCIVASSFALLLCYCIARYGMAIALGIVTVGCLAGGAILFIIVAVGRRAIENEAIERGVFPLMALCFFMLCLLPDPWRIVAACLIAALFVLFAAFHWSILIALARRFSITTPLHFATGLLSPGVGLCIGWAVAITFALAGGDLGQPYVLFFGWTVAYVIVISIAPYASDPLFEIDLLAPEKRVASATDRSENSWEMACAALADECGLSPREREVFSMLAHGRNAEHISGALFISTNTAKTHKYRIYRKLEVNTHQELLDRVEETESDLLNG